jgi:two-component system CheB/CheR fusion protein
MAAKPPESTDERRAALGRLLLEETPHFSIVATDPDGRIVWWNRGAEAMFRYSADEMLGADIGILFTPDDRAADISRNERQTSLVNGVAPDMRWHVRSDGSALWLAGGTILWRDADGRLLGHVKWAEDNTERHRTTEALQRRMQELEALVGHAAHDLRAPLRTIHNLLDILADDDASTLSEDAADLLARARRTTSDLADLVGELLSYVETGAYRPTVEAVDPNVIFDSVAVAVEADLRAADGVLTREALLPVCADPILLRRVLQNLIGNAIVHRGPQPPRILVGSRTLSESAVELRVDDNGPGVAADVRERIFEPFEHRDGQGTGLGLAIVRRIVEAHGGRVRVEDAPGGGASFCFTLRSA